MEGSGLGNLGLSGRGSGVSHLVLTLPSSHLVVCSVHSQVITSLKISSVWLHNTREMETNPRSTGETDTVNIKDQQQPRSSLETAREVEKSQPLEINSSEQLQKKKWLLGIKSMTLNWARRCIPLTSALRRQSHGDLNNQIK